MVGEGSRRSDRRAVDAKPPGRAVLRRGLEAVAELGRLSASLDFDRDRKAAGAMVSRAKSDLRAAQPATGREHRKSFENIGLAGAVFACERNELRVKPRVQRRIGAKIAQRQPARQRSGGASVFKRHRPWLCHARAKSASKAASLQRNAPSPLGAAPKMSIVPAARSQRGFSLG